MWQLPSEGSHQAFMATPIGASRVGISSTSLEDGAPVDPTTNAAGLVTNIGIPAGNSAFLNPVPRGHQYWEATGRLNYVPILTEDSLLHVGGSVRYQKPNDATAASDDRVLQPGGTLKRRSQYRRLVPAWHSAPDLRCGDSPAGRAKLRQGRLELWRRAGCRLWPFLRSGRISRHAL